MPASDPSAAPHDAPPSALRLVLVAFGGIAAAYLLGALTGAALTQWVQGTGGFWEEALLRKGPHRLMRRCAMLWAFAFLPFFLREIRWRGVHDIGITDGRHPFDRSGALRHVAIAFAIGWSMLAIIGLLHYTTGLRVWIPERTLSQVVLHALRVTLQCFTVALIEEIAFRGILFRCISRAWGPWPTALFLSALFALLHLMKPARSVAEAGDGLLEMTGQGLLSMFTALPEIPHLELRLLNLTLMSVALCAVCLRTRTIWAAVGLHAGWVWVKLENGYVTNVNRAREWSIWVGHRSDTTDSLLCTLLLLGILIWAVRKPDLSEKHATMC